MADQSFAAPARAIKEHCVGHGGRDHDWKKFLESSDSPSGTGSAADREQV